MQNQMICDATQRATKQAGCRGTLVNNYLSRNSGFFFITLLKYSVCITQGIDRCIDRYIHTRLYTDAALVKILSCLVIFLGSLLKILCLSCKHRICKSIYQPKAHTQFTLLPKFPSAVAPATGCTVLFIYCRSKQHTIFNADIDSLFLTTFNFSFSGTKGGNVYIYMKLKSCSLMQMMREREEYVKEAVSFYVKKRGRAAVAENLLHMRRKKRFFVQGKLYLCLWMEAAELGFPHTVNLSFWRQEEKRTGYNVCGLIKPQFY